MAGNIKGITIEFRGDTTKLDKALREIKNESKSVDQQLREVNRSLKFNPGNTELLRQKFTLLGQKVDLTEKQLKEFRAAEQQLRGQGVSEESAEWMKLRRNIIETESKLKHYKTEVKKMTYQNVTKMGEAFKKAGQNMRTAGMYSSIGGAAMIVTGKKLLELNATQSQAETKLTEIYKTRMGATDAAAKSTMELASALQKEGVIGDEVALSGAQQLATYASMPETVNKLLPSMENLLVQQKGVNATAEDATSIANLFGKAMMGQTGALKKVGISFTDAQEEVLKYGTEEEKAAMLSEVVTQNVGNMNKVFAETPEGQMAQLKNTLGDIGERLGAVLLPALASAATWISDNLVPSIENMVTFIEEHPTISKIAVALAAVLAVGGPLLIFIGALVGAIGTITTAFTSMAAAETIALGPIALIVAGIAALIAIGVLLYKNWDTIKKYATKAWSAIKNAIITAFTAVKNFFVKTLAAIKAMFLAAFNLVKSYIVNPVKNAVRTVKETIKNLQTSISTKLSNLKQTVSDKFNAVKDAMLSPIEKARDLIQGIIEKIKGFFNFKAQLPKIKLPHFAIEPPGWHIGDLLQGIVPWIGIDWYKKGGIFNRPTVAGLGDVRGGEAALPLEPFWNKMDKIVEAVGGGGDAITINVYGSPGMDVNALAAEVERRMTRVQKQKGAVWT